MTGSIVSAAKGEDVQGLIDSATKAASDKSAIPKGAVVPSGRIVVKGPDGSMHTLPAAQLQDAMKAGYQQVQ